MLKTVLISSHPFSKDVRSSSLDDGFVKVVADIVAVTVSSISSLGFSGDVAVSVPENF